MDFTGMSSGWTFDKYIAHIVPLLPNNIRAAEVGSFKGYGAISLAVTAREQKKSIEIIAVDRYDGWKGSHIDVIQSNIHELKLEHDILPLKSDSADAAKLFADHSFDYVFIDADHSYMSARADILAWRPKVKSGGILAGHDYATTQQGVVKAVDQIFPKVEVLENCWYIRLP